MHRVVYLLLLSAVALATSGEYVTLIPHCLGIIYDFSCGWTLNIVCSLCDTGTFPQTVWLPVWLSDNAFVSISEVMLHWAWLVCGWMTVCGQVNHLPRATQPDLDGYEVVDDELRHEGLMWLIGVVAYLQHGSSCSLVCRTIDGHIMCCIIVSFCEDTSSVDIIAQWEEGRLSASVVKQHLVCDPTLWQPVFNSCNVFTSAVRIFEISNQIE